MTNEDWKAKSKANWRKYWPWFVFMVGAIGIIGAVLIDPNAGAGLTCYGCDASGNLWSPGIDFWVNLFAVLIVFVTIVFSLSLVYGYRTSLIWPTNREEP